MAWAPCCVFSWTRTHSTDNCLFFSLTYAEGNSWMSTPDIGVQQFPLCLFVCLHLRHNPTWSSNPVCLWGWPWTSDPPSSWMWELQVYTLLWGSRNQSRTSCLLGNHSASWTTSLVLNYSYPFVILSYSCFNCKVVPFLFLISCSWRERGMEDIADNPHCVQTALPNQPAWAGALNHNCS